MDPERLVADIYELMDYADELQKRERRRGRGYGAPLRKTPAYYEGALAKGGDDEDAYAAHAEVKSRHHAALGELYETISAQHRRMARRYSSGAHTREGADGDEVDDHRERENIDAVDEARIQKLLRAAARDGDLATREQAALLGHDAVRECVRHPQFGDPATAERGGSR